MLELGGLTQLGGLLYHLPLFGGQRRQSHNILVLDLALAVLLADQAGQPSPRSRARGDRAGGRVQVESLPGAVPALAVIPVAVLGCSLAAEDGLVLVGAFGSPAFIPRAVLREWPR